MQLDQRLLRGWQACIDQTQDDDPYRIRYLHENPDRQGDECWGSPADLHHRADQETALGGWEKVANVADDGGRVRYRVRWEKHRVERMCAKAGVQSVLGRSSVDTNETAHAVQCEPETELDGRQVERDDQQEGEASRAIGHDRVKNGDDLDLDSVQQRGIEDARVLTLGRIEED